jgi:hypothetical protein
MALMMSADLLAAVSSHLISTSNLDTEQAWSTCEALRAAVAEKQIQQTLSQNTQLMLSLFDTFAASVSSLGVCNRLSFSLVGVLFHLTMQTSVQQLLIMPQCSAFFPALVMFIRGNEQQEPQWRFFAVQVCTRLTRSLPNHIFMMSPEFGLLPTLMQICSFDTTDNQFASVAALNNFAYFLVAPNRLVEEGLPEFLVQMIHDAGADESQWPMSHGSKGYGGPGK